VQAGGGARNDHPVSPPGDGCSLCNTRDNGRQ
jgi:hypothetical protein